MMDLRRSALGRSERRGKGDADFSAAAQYVADLAGVRLSDKQE
jgi:hypothetical protein